MKTLQLKSLIVYLVIALLIFFLDGTKLLDAPKAVFYKVAAPEQYVVYGLKMNVLDTFSFLTFWKSGEQRIKYLESRIVELSAAKNRSDTLEKENRELRKQLGVAKLVDKKQLPAIVLGESRYLEIGVGTDLGVKVGQMVVYGDNLVGRVAKASQTISFVQQPFDPDSLVPVRIGLARGLVKGQFGLGLKLSQVAQNEDIRGNDLVLTSGEGGTYLPELVVGKIGKISTDTTGLFKEAEVLPLVDVSKLTTIFVILN